MGEETRKATSFVIPAKAGIQSFAVCNFFLDPGLRRGDDPWQFFDFSFHNYRLKLRIVLCHERQ